MTGERFDLTSDDGVLGELESRQPAGRPFVGLHYACCGIYSRIYVNRDKTAYCGNCPKCGRRVELRIGPGGTDARFFTAY